MPETITRTEKRILELRGFQSEEEMRFFKYRRTEDLPPFSALCDGERLLLALTEALDQKKHITVYGDYDADGVMSMTILCRGLEKLDPGRIRWFANDRFSDGYSISVSSLERLLCRFPETEVVLTCDNGIGAKEAWEEALRRGIEVLVTDHHEQAKDRVLPENVPSVCEKSVRQKEWNKENGKTPELFCGAELARRLITELYGRRGIAEENADFLESLYLYAGIATITDVVPLNASNHCVARKAVELLRSSEGFFKTLYEELCGVQRPIEAAGEDTFSFYFGPAVNACSRVQGSVELPMKVFLAEGEAQVSDIGEMALINKERQEWTKEDLAICEKQIRSQNAENDPFLLVADQALREGINGLSAGRLTERYRVPSVVLGGTEDPDLFKGSARSVDEVNIFEELYQCRDLLVVYGGHPKAAGLTIRKDNLDEFTRRMKDSIAKKVKRREISVNDGDFSLKPELLTGQHITEMKEALEGLLPFGEGFKRPSFYLEGEIRNLYYMSDGTHAKAELAALSKDQRKIYLLLWSRGEECKKWEKALGGKAKKVRGIVAFPEVNEYNGGINYQMQAQQMEFCIPETHPGSHTEEDTDLPS